MSLLLAIALAWTGGDDVARVVDLPQDVTGTLLLAAGKGKPARLLVASRGGIEIRPLAEGDGATPRFEWPRADDATLAYCAVRGADGTDAVFVTDGRRTIWRWDPATGEKREMLAGVQLILPSGVYHLPFARDLDGDGDVDLALPRLNGFQLYFGEGAEGAGFVKGPQVQHRVSLDVSIDGYDAEDPQLSQSIRIPAFTVSDQNGDGKLDLAFRDQKLVQFFWTGKDGRLPPQPTFSLDIEQIENSLPKRTRGIIDTSNLLKALDSKVSVKPRDIDGDGIADLLMQKGKNVLIYRGTRDGIDRTKPAAVLPTSGNLLSVTLYDEDGDGLEDLYMLHVGDISVGKVIVWLVAGGTLDLQLFVYRQEGPLKFARKPSSRRAVAISLPSALTTIDELKAAVAGIADQLQRMPAVGDLDGDGEKDDLAALEGGEVRGYLGAWGAAASAVDSGSDQISWIEVTRRFDREAKGARELTVSLKQAIDWVPLLPLDLHAAAAAQPADRRWSLGDTGGFEPNALYLLDVDGDGRDDPVVLCRSKEGALRLRFP